MTNDQNMLRSRPYEGQPHTDAGIRGQTEISGITFRDLRDCFTRAAVFAASDQVPELYDEATKGEHARICEDDVRKIDFNNASIIALAQNMSCEVERLMGIFPNIPSEETGAVAGSDDPRS